MALFLAASNFGHRYGRRVSIMFGDALIIIGGLIQATSFCMQSPCVPDFCGIAADEENSRRPDHHSACDLRARNRAGLSYRTNLHERDNDQQDRARSAGRHSVHLFDQWCCSGILGKVLTHSLHQIHFTTDNRLTNRPCSRWISALLA